MSIRVIERGYNVNLQNDRCKKRKLDNLLESKLNNIYSKKLKITNTSLNIKKKRKIVCDNNYATIRHKKHITYYCCVHSNNKNICKIYDCCGITNNVKTLFNYFY